jgi:hypothetical protein
MNAYPAPALLRGLPRQSRAHTLTWLSLRSFWHELYDPCPRLREHLGTSIDACFDAFIDAVVASGHRMDWTLHLELAAYCGIEAAGLLEEVCVAAVRRWVRMDCTVAAWIALRPAASAERVFVGVRASSLNQSPQVLRAKLPGHEEPPHGFAYQTGTSVFTRPGPLWDAYRPFLST